MYFLKQAERYVDTVQISSGIDKVFEANVHCITTNLEEEMPNLKWAKIAKQELKIPVSVVSAVMTPEMADEIIAKGYVDMVAFGRTLLADRTGRRKHWRSIRKTLFRVSDAPTVITFPQTTGM